MWRCVPHPTAPHFSQGQEDVFREVREFVQSALDGYNVTLFSYGQTGSGKTHSMQGSGHGNMRGIIPRSIEQVYLVSSIVKERKREEKERFIRKRWLLIRFAPSRSERPR